jgi:hypothetical protein
LLTIKAAALHALGRTEEADAVRQQWISIIDSILFRGDGKDYATAFKVISVAEERDIVQLLEKAGAKE